MSSAPKGRNRAEVREVWAPDARTRCLRVRHLAVCLSGPRGAPLGGSPAADGTDGHRPTHTREHARYDLRRKAAVRGGAGDGGGDG